MPQGRARGRARGRPRTAGKNPGRFPASCYIVINLFLPPEELAAIAARRPGDPTPAVAATAGLTPGRGRGGSGDREQLARGRGVSQERAGEGAVTVPASGKMTSDFQNFMVNYCHA